MAYATTTDDVQPLVAVYLTLTTTSVPTLAQVGRWVDETSARIDSALRAAGYTDVPATGTTDLVMLRGMVANEVARKALLVGLGYDQANKLGINDLFGGFAAFIKSINDGDEVLVDQSPTVGTIGMIQAGVYGRESVPTTRTRCYPYGRWGW